MRIVLIPRILSVILFSVAVLGAQPAKAQLPNTGLNIGIALSGNWVDLDVTEIDMTAPMPAGGYPTTVGGVEFDEFGATLAVGYNLIIGAVIAGVIADITLANFSDSYEGSKYSADYIATLRAQIGMQVLPGVIAYLTGGLAWMDASYRGTIPGGGGGTPPPTPPPPAAPPPATAQISRDSELLNGWVVGVGAEVNTGIDLGTGPVMARAEFLHGRFDDWKFWKGSELYKVDTEMNIVRLGIVVPLGIGAGN